MSERRGARAPGHDRGHRRRRQDDARAPRWPGRCASAGVDVVAAARAGRRRGRRADPRDRQGARARDRPARRGAALRRLARAARRRARRAGAGGGPLGRCSTATSTPRSPTRARAAASASRRCARSTRSAPAASPPTARCCCRSTPPPGARAAAAATRCPDRLEARARRVLRRDRRRLRRAGGGGAGGAIARSTPSAPPERVLAAALAELADLALTALRPGERRCPAGRPKAVRGGTASPTMSRVLIAVAACSQLLALRRAGDASIAATLLGGSSRPGCAQRARTRSARGRATAPAGVLAEFGDWLRLGPLTRASRRRFWAARLAAPGAGIGLAADAAGSKIPGRSSRLSRSVRSEAEHPRPHRTFARASMAATQRGTSHGSKPHRHTDRHRLR